MNDRSNANPDDEARRRRFRDEAWPELPSLVRVARVLAGEANAADDLVQETMLRAFRHFDRFTPGTNIRAWLMTILRRTHIDLHRREGKRAGATILLESLDRFEATKQSPDAAADDRSLDEGPSEREGEPGVDPDAVLGRFEDEQIEAALRALPDPMRWTLLLVDVERLSTREAAAVMGVAEGTVKSRASRARGELRKRLLPRARRRGWIEAAGGKPNRPGRQTGRPSTAPQTTDPGA